MTDKELDDLFQKSFSGHQMPVPPDMWDRVNPQKEKRRRGIILWWSGLGVAALFMLVGGATWLYHTSPEKKVIAVTATKTVKEQSGTSSAKNITPLNQPSTTNGKTELKDNSADENSITQSSDTEASSQNKQTNQSNNKINNHIVNFYTHSTTNKKRLVAAGEKQNSLIYQTNGFKKSKQNNNLKSNKQDNSITTIEQSNGEANSNNDNTSEPVITLNSSPATPQSNQAISTQKPDSNVFAATNNTATQQPKGAAVKVKRIPGEKASSLELMIAGYGNSRHVYGVDQMSAAGLVAFGPVSQKEKVLMNSVSVNARIDKPVTRNFSLKTGLQFLQTYQRVSYNYETVNQTVSISSSSNDTTVFARLQSKQSVVNGTYNSLSIPLLINYHTNGTKMNLGATAGVMVNVLSWYKGSVPDARNSQIVEASNTFRTHTGASLYAGLTASKTIGSFQLFAEPHLQYTLSSVTKNSASFRQKITSYGLGIGIRKRIGK